MPTYDYICNACSNKWEEFRSIAEREEPLKNPCPNCGKKKNIDRLWENGPVMGVDATKGPGSDFKRLMEKMSRGVPKSSKENLDRAASFTGRKYGPG